MGALWIIAFFVAGFLIGKATCNPYKEGFGLLITVIMIVVINGTHSMIDGMSLVSVSPVYGAWTLLIHEGLRQTFLYLSFFTIVKRFRLNRAIRFIVGFLSITGIWMLGSCAGYFLATCISALPWIKPAADYLHFLIVGDLIHHALHSRWYMKKI